MDNVNRAYTKELGFIADAICFGAIFLFVSQYFEAFKSQESEYFFSFTAILIVGLVAVGYFSRNRFLFI